MPGKQIKSKKLSSNSFNKQVIRLYL